MEWKERITTAPYNGQGRACFRGTHVRVSTVLTELAKGMASEEVLRRHSRLTPEDLQAALAYSAEQAKRSVLVKRLFFWLGMALLLRMALAFLPIAFWGDLLLYKDWSFKLVQLGLGNFYSQVWCDYPPGCLYLFWLWGNAYKLLIDPLFVTTGLTPYTIWLKTLPIIADVASAALIYRILRGRVSHRSAYLSAIAFAFNPAVVFNSAIWGQVDSLLILQFLLVSWALVENRLVAASLLTTIAVLMKPQGLFLVPLLLFSQWYRHGMLKWVITGLSSLSLAWVMIFPMCPGFSWSAPLEPFRFLLSKMLVTAGQYPFSSFNAFNIWFFHQNLKTDQAPMLLLSVHAWGMLFLILLQLLLACYLYRRRGTFALFAAASLSTMGFFLFSTRMHERYFLPALAFLAIAAGVNSSIRWLYGAFSLVGFINLAWVFSFNYYPIPWLNTFVEGPGKGILVFMNLWLFCLLLGRILPSVQRGKDRATPEKGMIPIKGEG